MIFSSSPIFYRQSSSPPVPSQKRKLFQTFKPKDASPKRPKILGGFLLEDGSDDEQENPVSLNSTVQTTWPSVENNTNTDIAAVPNVVQILGDRQGDETRPRSPNLTPAPAYFSSRLTPKTVELQTSSGHEVKIRKRTREVEKSYEQTIAERSTTAPGRAQKAYYGVDIHKLIDEAKIQKELQNAAAEFKRQNEPAQSVEQDSVQNTKHNAGPGTCQMWTEKYRARKFTELVGDERTHRSVLRWLKSWDSVVFTGNSTLKSKKIYEDQDQQHKKILLLTGPPGLGKTTLAHVCAKQAGYEVLEINASDDRSRDVVRGRIRDALGTETVRGVREQGKSRKAGRPVCVVVDEVDGVVTGSGGSGGEGGFMKALIDLVQLDQRNSTGQQTSSKGSRKGDKFRLMRPMILICNDVFAPSLRPLRQSSIAEIVHVRKPAIEKVILRLKTIFEKERINCDNDAVRRLCESAWGLGTRKQNTASGRGAGDGDIRGVLVHGEWIAQKLRATNRGDSRLTRKWVEENMSQSGASQDGLGRGGTKEVVERIFVEGAGLPNLPTVLSQEEARLVAESKTSPIGIADLRKRAAISALRAMIDTTGDHDRLMTECFTTYPSQVYQDDTLLSKPNTGYEWLHFHDMLSSKIYAGQEWELNPYLSTSACGFHSLFAAVDKGARGWNDEKPQNEDASTDTHPFSGPKADFAAYEAEKANRNILTAMQAGFSASLLRLFSSVDAMAMELVPNASRMLAPDVKPVVVGGSGSIASVASVRKESEKNCIQNAVRVMHGLGIEFEKIKIESEGFGAHANGGFALRMEPPLDSLSTYYMSKTVSSNTNSGTTTSKLTVTKALTTAPVRYAVRQVLTQELIKEKAYQASLSRQARTAGHSITTSPTHPVTNKNYNDTNNKENIPSGLGLKTIEPTTTTTTSVPAPGPGATVLNGPVKRDFFGRIITACPANSAPRPTSRGTSHTRHASSAGVSGGTKDEEIAGNAQRTWVSFHEGYSNAVRKYIGLRELMEGF